MLSHFVLDIDTKHRLLWEPQTRSEVSKQTINAAWITFVPNDRSTILLSGRMLNETAHCSEGKLAIAAL